MSRHLILYDGECGLCRRIVQWLLQTDRHGRFQFAPIQGQTAATVWPRHGITGDKLEGMWLVTDWTQPAERLFHRAEAALEIARLLGGIYTFAAAVARLIPFASREKLYLWIARNRYRWFGKASPADLPQADARFLR